MRRSLAPGCLPTATSTPRKDEYFLVLKGEILPVEFDDSGHLIDFFLMNPLLGNFGCEVKAGVWHTVIPLAPGSIIYEFKEGAFVPVLPENIASRASNADDKEAATWWTQRVMDEIDSLKKQH